MDDALRIRIMPWSEARTEAQLIREAVFVAEQGVPPEIELDDWDERSEHAVAYDVAGRPVGTGRLLPDGHIGRMAVLRESRGKGVGGRLLEALIARARVRGMQRVALNAQTHAAPFYARFGFVVAGEEFMEAGIPHLAMAREL
ncbi:MAG TPA: GNAT family N-acetyltransferase [Burkholderiales bacterium]|jgi:predicted GNAT family N-acyltransferase|nr:GNAT family N-acetyltransferase [Burkholderiales bacterium]